MGREPVVSPTDALYVTCLVTEQSRAGLACKSLGTTKKSLRTGKDLQTQELVEKEHRKNPIGYRWDYMDRLCIVLYCLFLWKKKITFYVFIVPVLVVYHPAKMLSINHISIFNPNDRCICSR